MPEYVTEDELAAWLKDQGEPYEIDDADLLSKPLLEEFVLTRRTPAPRRDLPA